MSSVSSQMNLEPGQAPLGPHALLMGAGGAQWGSGSDDEEGVLDGHMQTGGHQRPRVL